MCLNRLLCSCKLRKWNSGHKPESMCGLAEMCRACDLLSHQCYDFESCYSQRICVPGQDTLSQFDPLIRAHPGPVGCGEYCSLSADRVCTWQVAHYPRWSELIVMIFWCNNDTQAAVVCILKEKALYKCRLLYEPKSKCFIISSWSTVFMYQNASNFPEYTSIW